MMHITEKKTLPPVGLRMVKSAIAVALCFLISLLRGDSGIVFYSQLAALWCIQIYIKNSFKMATQRTIGTVIGAIYGLIVILIRQEMEQTVGMSEFAYDMLVSFTILVVLYTSILIRKKQSSYFSCVVFLSIVVNHITDQNPYLFVWNRFLDTMIGIIIGIGVNAFQLPKKKKKDILFVSGLDDTLLNEKDNMSDYSRVELNRILDDGALFTISTIRTPASLMEPMRDIKLNLPVIAMDGAVLYDIQNKQYLKAYIISHKRAKELLDVFDTLSIHCFINVIIDDMLVIYYGDISDSIQQKLVNQMRKSPYRNYVQRTLPESEDVVYLMVLDKKERVEMAYQELEKRGYTTEFKVLHYESKDYPGYAYIKIYNRNASKQHMIEYLIQKLAVHRTVTFGSIPGKYDVVVQTGDSNRVVKMVKKLYEPVIWQKEQF